MKLYMGFCVHLERNSLSVYRGDKSSQFIANFVETNESTHFIYNSHFSASSHSCEKRKLASQFFPSVHMSVCLSFRLSARIRAVLTGRFPLNLTPRTFMKICRENPNLVRIGQFACRLSNFYCCRPH